MNGSKENSQDKEAIRKAAFRKQMGEFGDIQLLPVPIRGGCNRPQEISSDEIFKFAKHRIVRLATTKKNKVKELPVTVPQNQLNLNL